MTFGPSFWSTSSDEHGLLRKREALGHVFRSRPVAEAAGALGFEELIERHGILMISRVEEKDLV